MRQTSNVDMVICGVKRTCPPKNIQGKILFLTENEKVWIEIKEWEESTIYCNETNILLFLFSKVRPMYTASSVVLEHSGLRSPQMPDSWTFSSVVGYRV